MANDFGSNLTQTLAIKEGHKIPIVNIHNSQYLGQLFMGSPQS